jgi:hypothetical protein
MNDYTNEGFILPIQRDDEIGYASVNSIMAREEDGIGNTGSYFVYLLHPVMGSTHFTLEPGNSYTGWEKIGGAVWLKDDIVQEVFDAIEARKTKSTGKLS